MSIPGSGTIKFSDLQALYGTGTPVSLSKMYRGGLFVPNIMENSNVPATGKLSCSKFYSTRKTGGGPYGYRAFGPVAGDQYTLNATSSNKVITACNITYTTYDNFAFARWFFGSNSIANNYSWSDGMWGRDQPPLPGQSNGEWWMIKYGTAFSSSNMPYIIRYTSDGAYTNRGSINPSIFKPSPPTATNTVGTLYGNFVHIEATVAVKVYNFDMKTDSGLLEFYVVGSNDNTNWTVLFYKKFNGDQPTGTNGVNYTITSPGNYKYYRWVFTQLTSETAFALHRLVPYL